MIKIEDTGVLATTPVPWVLTDVRQAAGWRQPLFFRMINRNKKSLRLDSKQAAGVEVFLRLARDADVISWVRPGVGQAGNRLRWRYARSIRASSTAPLPATDRAGPWAELAAHDINLSPSRGCSTQIGAHDGKSSGAPAIPNLQIGDLLGSAYSAGCCPRGSDRCQVDGAGATADGAMTDAVLAHTIFPLVTTLVHGRTALARRGPADRRGALLRRVAPADDRWSGGWRPGTEVLADPVYGDRASWIWRPSALKLPVTRAGASRPNWRNDSPRGPWQHWQPRSAAADCCVTPCPAHG
ncbi:MAG: CoA transferase [Sulfuritalea sp.]|nr:CoA transferase [Sulfuritalea sp.]